MSEGKNPVGAWRPIVEDVSSTRGHVAVVPSSGAATAACKKSAGYTKY